MSAAAIILLILAILAAIGLILAVVIYFLRGQVKRIGTSWAAQGFTFRKGPEHASYQGHASVTVPMRGSGVLGLTDHDLRLRQIVPRREFVIPLAQITQVEQHRAWKGRYSPGTPVIVVHYRDGDQEDAIGFSVRDPQGWLDALSAAAKG